MLGLKLDALKIGLGRNTFLMKLAATCSVLAQKSCEKKLVFSQETLFSMFFVMVSCGKDFFPSGLKRDLFHDKERKDTLSQLIGSSAFWMKTS